MAVDHYENFPVASWLCPPRLRPAIAALYWYARTADDLADEGNVAPAQRLELLAAYRRDLAAALEGRATSERWPHVFAPLAQAAAAHGLPRAPLEALLSAFEQDVVKQRYADRAELLDYCSRSANPVGRLLLCLYKVDGEEALRQSDCICTALQLINFWQDLSVDLPRGRLYVPQSDLSHFGLAAEQLRLRQDSAATSALVAELVQWARRLMLEGTPLVHGLPGRAGWELRLVVQGGLRMLDKIAAMNYATLARRPRLRAWDAPLMLWRALRMRRGVTP